MRFYLERTARAVLTIWVAISITFGVIRFLPGGPLVQLRLELARNNPSMSAQEINGLLETYEEQLNLQPDQPLYVEYVNYMISLLQGDLGISFSHGDPVASIVAESLPWTLFVMTSATILVFVIAILWGAVIAYKEGTVFDVSSSSVSILFSAVPFYVLAFVLILIFGFRLEMLPTGGKTTPLLEPGLRPEYVIDVLEHAILPILSVALTQAGLQTLAMRGNSIQVLGEDYVRVARLRGLADRRISTRYVARNAILPMYTGFLTLIGFNLGSSIILEQVFSYRAMGWYMFDALENRDYSLMMGIFLVFTVALVLAVFIADLTYSKVDPRVKQGESSEAY